MVYFYSCVLKSKNGEERFNGTIKINGKINSRQLVVFKDEIKKKIFQLKRHNFSVMEKPEIIFKAFYQLNP